MPIIVPGAGHPDPLFARLAEAGAALIDEETAEQQNFRNITRIGLLNLMPALAMEATETQWFGHISHTEIPIELVLVKLDDDPREREGASRSTILSRYTPLAEVRDKGLDGLIITGANLEVEKHHDGTQSAIDFSDISYAPQLTEAIRWSVDNVHSTIYSCLASHFALNSLYNLQREIVPKKIFGVFEHHVNTTNSPITLGIGDTIRAPHSRWGNVRAEDARRAGLTILAIHEKIGWLLLEDLDNGLHIQGHPEYHERALGDEYERDRDAGQAPPLNDCENKDPELLTQDAHTLFSNWISGIRSSNS